MDLKGCLETNLIRHVRPNRKLARSLLETSEIKSSVVLKAKIDGENVSAYVLDAVCVTRGFKVLSHDCVGALLSDEIDGFDRRAFDTVRHARNGVSYRGERVSLAQGRMLIETAFRLRDSILQKNLI